MKKIIVGIIIGLVSIPALAQAQGWACRAESDHAIGYSAGYSSEWAARQRALNECAVRTPRYDTCYIIRCWWEY